MSNGYAVLIDDNFHCMNEDERVFHGRFSTLDEAISACKEIVDEYLCAALEPGMTADDLYRSYTSFGEDPFIVGGPAGGPLVPFSAWDYAKQRSEQIVAANEAAANPIH